MGWKSDPQVEAFYREKISHFEKESHRTPSSNFQEQESIQGSTDSLVGRFSSSAEKSESPVLEKDRLVVNNEGKSVELFVTSTDSELVKEAKAVLSKYFFSKSASGFPQIQYSREELLSMARTSSAGLIPSGLRGVTAELPEIFKKV